MIILQKINDMADSRNWFVKGAGWVLLVIAVIVCVCISSCQKEDLDIQQAYPFTVDVMPYRDKIAVGETVELRMAIKAEGNYDKTAYTIRYFQYEGDGSLSLDGTTILTDNDRFLLPDKEFRLYYTSNSPDSHKFLVTVEDNQGSAPWEQTFEFNNEEE